jgi:hypothetical protein
MNLHDIATEILDGIAGEQCRLNQHEEIVSVLHKHFDEFVDIWAVQRLLDLIHPGGHATASDAGVRVEWRTERGKLMLYLPAKPGDQENLYHRIGTKHGTDFEVSQRLLLDYLNSICTLEID